MPRRIDAGMYRNPKRAHIGAGIGQHLHRAATGHELRKHWKIAPGGTLPHDIRIQGVETDKQTAHQLFFRVPVKDQRWRSRARMTCRRRREYGLKWAARICPAPRSDI